MREYIVPIYDDSPDHDEIFVGYIRENAAEVVRCKDCRYYDYPFPDPKENADANPERWCCLLGMGGAFGKDSYCSYGERRNK